MIKLKNFLFLLLVITNMSRNLARKTRKRSAAEEIQKDNTPVCKATANVDISNFVDQSIGGITTSTHFEIPYTNKNIFCLSFGSPTVQLSMIFTHGAGGDLSSPAVVNFAKGFSECKRIVCFQGNMNLVSRTKMYKTVIEHQNWGDVLGGRSLGARAAILTAKETDNVKALILVSYPLRNQKGDVRNQILLDIAEGIDVLFVIGERDSMCDLGELRNVTKEMKARTWIVAINNANHGMEMSPQKATEPVGRMAGRVVAGWLEKRNEKLTNCKIQWDDNRNEVVVGPWSDEL